ncbi:metallophosphoesterase [Bacillus sp. PS06]|uniref:metallophosphoesterase n=1 Tax=Bacillus sp. PS06 TaxID=2764176 RepID=UPI0017811584|nr:metallophosphoesterase [Bacillus sp. PS06]MBD8068486.1 metallophosphoesterase [Bacillus sp. PS06]
MSNTYTRRQFLKSIFKTAFTAVLTSAFGYAYAKFIEPKWIEVTSHTLNHSYIPKSFDKIKIVQFSDTHIGHFFDLDHFSSIAQKINELEPDLVFFTGDLLDNPKIYPQPERLIPILSSIKAPLGKFSIYGNHDHGGYGSDIYKEMMDQSDFITLLNESREVTLQGEKITVVGLDDIMLGRPDFTHSFDQVDMEDYIIALVHEPDVAPKIAALGAHLQLSGHTHGGQIQFPFLGPIITPPLGKDYPEGDFLIGSSNMQLFVNRGLGTTRLPFRFLSRPEISEYILRSKS